MSTGNKQSSKEQENRRTRSAVFVHAKSVTRPDFLECIHCFSGVSSTQNPYFQTSSEQQLTEKKQRYAKEGRKGRFSCGSASRLLTWVLKYKLLLLQTSQAARERRTEKQQEKQMMMTTKMMTRICYLVLVMEKDSRTYWERVAESKSGTVQ